MGCLQRVVYNFFGCGGQTSGRCSCALAPLQGASSGGCRHTEALDIVVYKCVLCFRCFLRAKHTYCLLYASFWVGGNEEMGHVQTEGSIYLAYASRTEINALQKDWYETTAAVTLCMGAVVCSAAVCCCASMRPSLDLFRKRSNKVQVLLIKPRSGRIEKRTHLPSYQRLATPGPYINTRSHR